MSTITKERAQEIFLGNGPDPTASEERELARIALESLEAEPVMYAMAGEDLDADATSASKAVVDAWVEEWNQVGEPGYRTVTLYTAPPAPVSAPDERYQHLSELYHAQEKRLFKLAQRIKGPSFDKYAHSPSQAIDVLESALFGEITDACRAAMLQGAEPDFREISNSSTKHFRENAETSTKCWCHTCRPVTNSDMRFFVCPECGNKRCPHANDHRNACTGSNEPGQEGSAYPAAPQQEDK
ncbi:TPA: hypothetical protein ACOEHE_002566 [Enterobacter ludwigii]